MRLLDPGPGEVFDRLTILSLKIVNKSLDGIPIAHWQEERDRLIAHAGGTLHGGSASERLRWEHLLELAATNAALWQREDELRYYRGALATHQLHTYNAGMIAVQIQLLNDRRATLVSIININAGRPEGPEK